MLSTMAVTLTTPRWRGGHFLLVVIDLPPLPLDRFVVFERPGLAGGEVPDGRSKPDGVHGLWGRRQVALHGGQGYTLTTRSGQLGARAHGR